MTTLLNFNQSEKTCPEPHKTAHARKLASTAFSCSGQQSTLSLGR
ncbi:hypothetical protein [Tolypothrix sp. FACHB-123]|nr:hypothetical protein [Tolypothrix sp. FACHB-123]